MNTVIIETAVSVLSNLVVSLIAVLGAWLVAQIGKVQQLKTINAAVGELTNATESLPVSSGFFPGSFFPGSFRRCPSGSECLSSFFVFSMLKSSQFKHI